MEQEREGLGPEGLGWVRAELATAAVGLGALALAHAGEVRWGMFWAAFWAIDLVGYVPGAVAFRAAGRGPIAPVFHRLYNGTHNFLTIGAMTAAWALVHGGFEWAMLAGPIHLCGDRGLLGNFYKTPGEGFEPEPVPRLALAGEGGMA